MAAVRACREPPLGGSGMDRGARPRRGRVAQAPRRERLRSGELRRVPVRPSADDREREGHPAAPRIRPRADPRRGLLDAAQDGEGHDDLTMREILPGILHWTWFAERQGYDFNGYLLRLPEGNLCVDPVEMTDEVLREIAGEGVQRIALTNRNHFRASMKV